MEEKELYELFEVTPEGENEQDTAEPATEEEDTGEKEQEETEETEEAEETETDEVAAEPAEQTKEERRKQAAARRAKELEDAKNAARAEAQQAMNDRIAKAFQKAGLKNPFKDGAQIQTLDELEEYQQEFQRQKTDKDFKNGTITRETIEQVIAETQGAQQQNLQAARELQQARDERIIDEQIEKLKVLDPSIKDRESLVKALQDGETGLKMQSYVKMGLSFEDAWKLTHMEDLQKRAAEKASARTEKNIRGKEHLKSINAQSKGSKPISKAEMDLFHSMLPNLSDRQIEDWYAKTYKE